MQDLRLELEKTAYRPKEVLQGRAVWKLQEAPEAVEVRLFWYTSGKGDRDTEIVDTKRIETVGSTGERSFSFTLPGEPYSFSGKLITLVWAVELVFEPNGETIREEFVVAPGEQEVNLYGAPL